MKSKGSEPPSLFDNLDLFAQTAENEAEKGEQTCVWHKKRNGHHHCEEQHHSPEYHIFLFHHSGTLNTDKDKEKLLPL